MFHLAHATLYCCFSLEAAASGYLLKATLCWIAACLWWLVAFRDYRQARAKSPTAE